MTMTQPSERRIHTRYKLAPMYSPVTVQVIENMKILRSEGHAYDISESGLRIELDEPLEIGQTVALNLTLPCEEASLFVAADVVWVNDEIDDPGPRRMALTFTDFLSEVDRIRLLKFVSTCSSKVAA